ncbi:MAG: glycosyltransferase [Methylomarinum sp.]|nr:glycosyltransferase [Methylomarinum sp.]
MTTKQHLKVIIQILHYGNINDTLECLESIFKLNYPNYHVLLIDNTDKNTEPETSLDELYMQGDINLIKTHKNLGFTGGHNFGFNYSLQQGADYIWVLNNDTVVLPDTLDKLISCIETGEKIGAVTPIIYHFGSDRIQYLASIIDIKSKQITYTKSFNQLDQWKQEKQSFCLWGTALLLRSSMLKEIGVFYEDLFAYYEDTELSYRILTNGYLTNIATDAIIYHKHERTDNSLLRKPHFYFYMARNELMYLKKHSSGLQILATYRFCFVNMLDWLAICLRHNNDECATAVLDGFYCACINHGGPWKNDKHMPKLIGKFLKRFAWPLYRLLN